MKTNNQHTNNAKVEEPQSLIGDYLNNNLSEEERYRLEESMMEDSFEADALEGLQQLENKQELNTIQQNLSRYIHKKTKARKGRFGKTLLFPRWITLAIIILFGLIILGFFIISKLMNP